MFGEDESESPRLPSPWRAVDGPASSSETPVRQGDNGHISNGEAHHGDAETRRRQDIAAELEQGLAAFSLESDDAHALVPASRNGRHQFLVPESDTTGHIEYKLKLQTSSPMRLAKLATQLKFRLVEGGGTALYELGVLDDGTLCGLPLADMKQTISTLGAMLRTLGGGSINITHVVKLTADEEIVERAVRRSGDDEAAEHEHFRSFEVEGDDGEEQETPFSMSLPNRTATLASPRFRRVHRPLTEQEKAEKRRKKRTNARVRRELASLDASPECLTPLSDDTAPQSRDEGRQSGESAAPAAADTRPVPTRTPATDSRLECSARAEEVTPSFSRDELAKPVGSEVRYVVEAQVISRSHGGGSDGSDDGEGWRYLDFGSL